MKFTVYLMDAGSELLKFPGPCSNNLRFNSVEEQDLRTLLNFVEKYGVSVGIAIQYDPASSKATIENADDPELIGGEENG